MGRSTGLANRPAAAKWPSQINQLLPEENCYRELLIPVIGLGEMTCLNLPDQSASLLSGTLSWSKVLDQPVTAPGNWLLRISYTSHWSR